MVDTGRFLVAASHNEVCTTSYAAISVGYGWTSTANPNNTEPNNSGTSATTISNAGTEGKYLSGVHKMLITK